MSESFDPYRDWLGIPSTQRPITHYVLLGLPSSESGAASIEVAFTRRVGIVRAQLNSEHRRIAQRLLIELESAKACLSNTKAKAQYDALQPAMAKRLGQNRESIVNFRDDDELALAPLEEDELR